MLSLMSHLHKFKFHFTRFTLRKLFIKMIIIRKVKYCNNNNNLLIEQTGRSKTNQVQIELAGVVIQRQNCTIFC
ncbi:hypothetical protein GLOIN_2v1608937 [Rhizophagus irregularis DAOM 181602=DAOM 197198]|uniref:Uncharacterized protein n=1 Tax=Rhizophagus irregularis (strain DAOM 181602 / DAOM 197198 / MUCL 43194) TaxID=747089 RepID=A0A2P4Q0Z2_RHIID|nr:hypothetical protein GLOIN_2v1608937 [Rhizophagus irregularis DAOM 181602=DAOM 197198]POG71278.1 hypothetical protein GLOIN_2v1608937 [Rhizophagus irregularis DAOM 181602=DAOM 197198]|eukprot:XP_025178144.1 hypothetical protein GLOIN_2v1608937 [Rhizophagus irregularis DAOM 181602=DAOM 197198]